MATMRWIITLWTAYFVDLDNRQSRDSRLLMTAENAYAELPADILGR